jgi:hypothetical protein
MRERINRIIARETGQPLKNRLRWCCYRRRFVDRDDRFFCVTLDAVQPSCALADLAEEG